MSSCAHFRFSMPTSLRAYTSHRRVSHSLSSQQILSPFSKTRQITCTSSLFRTTPVLRGLRLSGKLGYVYHIVFLLPGANIVHSSLQSHTFSIRSATCFLATRPRATPLVRPVQDSVARARARSPFRLSSLFLRPRAPALLRSRVPSNRARYLANVYRTSLSFVSVIARLYGRICSSGSRLSRSHESSRSFLIVNMDPASVFIPPYIQNVHSLHGISLHGILLFWSSMLFFSRSNRISSRRLLSCTTSCFPTALSLHISGVLVVCASSCRSFRFLHSFVRTCSPLPTPPFYRRKYIIESNIETASEAF